MGGSGGRLVVIRGSRLMLGVGMGWWLEGDVGECESCHILVIDKGI